jgi:NAD+ synthase (glutamine-hydrolysing)
MRPFNSLGYNIMAQNLRIILAQLNLLVGDIQGNSAKILAAIAQARDELRGDVVVFPELAISSYPPEDLLTYPDFHRQVNDTLQDLVKQVSGIDVILGYPHLSAGGLYNAAALIRAGQIRAVYHKQHLPNYGVFDEKRYFALGHAPCIVHIKETPIAITICEDLWYADVALQAKQAGAQLIISLNASPFEIGKPKQREKILKQRVKECHLPIVYVHGVGGQDELLFDGGSTVINAEGEICAQAEFYQEQLLPVDIQLQPHMQISKTTISPPLTTEASVYGALVLGVKDYINKNQLSGAIIGLSGGIDSALTLAIAVDALGAERVEAVMLPSRYTSAQSLEDAALQAKQLGVKYRTISIENLFNVSLETLTAEIENNLADITTENLQARCRGLLLMALSNQAGKLVLTTGNKSEMAMGYATLYGDMAGGFAVLKDVPKTLVYRLAAYRNSLQPVIPQRVIDRAPSAELAPNQVDTDRLPPYDILDQILTLYVEQDKTLAEIVALGFDHEVVKQVLTAVNKNEYKRRQAPPGVRITRRAFGRDRRYPMTSGFSPDNS